MNIDDFVALANSFRTKRILVVGDTIVDINTYCKAIGLSAETPTMVIQRLPSDADRMHYDEVSLGGAALVVRNLLELGAGVDFITFCGGGREKHHVETFQGPKLTTHCIYPQQISRKPTTVKQRYWADGYKMIQVDTRDDSEIDAGAETRAITTFSSLRSGSHPPNHAAVVIADYRHGFITKKMAELFVQDFQGVPVYVSSQVAQRGSNHHWYDSTKTQFVFNEKENACVDRHQFQSKKWIITRGANGALDHYANSYAGHEEPAIPITPIDTCGAGDAFLAAYSLTDSLEFANLWAGLSCLIKGPNPPSLRQAEKYLMKEHQ